MRKLLLSAVILSLSSTAAMAMTGGVYAGAQVGYGDTGYDKHHAFIPTDRISTPYTDISTISGSVDATGLAGRAYGGLQLNPNLAVEGGYSLFSNSSATAAGGAVKASISAQAFDAAAKLIYPVTPTFNVYAKGGAALVRESQDLTFTNAGIVKISSTTNPIRPLFGAGAGYNITQNLAVEGSFTRIQGNNNIQNLDLYGAGFTYSFG